MKKVILLLIICLPTLTNAQTWCPSGATWYYGFADWMTVGYYKLEYIGDTTISSINCQKIKKTAYWENLGFMTSDTAIIGTEYTYSDTDKVYIFKHNQFYTLYDFAALPGATWTVPEIKNYTGCDTVGIIKVDSIGTTIINSEILRYICVSLNDTSQKWGWNAKIVEKIGPIKSYSNYDYLFPVKFDYCGMIVDEIIEGGSFRCYSDSSGFTYSSNIAPTCDYLTNVNNGSELNKNIIVFPNPANGTINIDLRNRTDILEFSVTNMFGQTIYIKNVNSSQIFSVENLQSGAFFISIKDKSNNVTKVKVINCL